MINFLRGFGGASETGRMTVSNQPPNGFVNVYNGGTRGSGDSGTMARRTIPDLSDDEDAAMPGTEKMKDLANIHTGGKRVIGDEKILQTLENLKGSGEKKVKLSMDYLTMYFEKAGLSGEVDVEKTRNGFKATITSGILFHSGTATIGKKAYTCLDGIIKLVKAVPYMIRIEGHTDNLPIHTDAYPSNWELSTARAVNVLRYFLDKGKIAPVRIAAVGFGEYHPIATNATPEGRSKNRRVDFYFEFIDQQENLSLRGTD